MRSIVVLGADRVGKSTAIRNTMEIIEKHSLSVQIHHFSGISPKDHSPVQQFTDTLMGINNLIDYTIFDRFVSDTLFYEPFRYKMPPIPFYVSQEPESMLLEYSSDVNVILIEHEWNGDIIERHREEIVEENPGCTEYWVKNQLEKRRIEHERYYKFTNNYLNTTTLIPRPCIHRLPGHLCTSTINLEMATTFKLF